ncbi:MAG TPA: ROK family protein [Candidatus Aquilonibacter sp.]|nr:ROK family protein [Candidatus Aquilonibacter sp.]
MTTGKKRIALAIDIGGTKAAAGYVDSQGRILAENRAPMVVNGRAQDGMQSVFEAIEGLQKKMPSVRPERAGIGVAGWVDPARGMLIGAANIPCWKNFPLVRAVEKRYGVSVLLANDANAAALAEATWGAGKGYRNIFYVTLGTGVGTGIVLDGKILAGTTGGAGEGGHVTINFDGPRCTCGKRGCIEAYSSGTGIARSAREHLQSEAERDSLLRRLSDGRVKRVSAEMVAEAARKKDRLAREVLDEAADHLAIWMGTVVDMFEPEIFIFGGGVGHLMMKYRARIRKQLERWAIAPQKEKIAIVEARFGAEAGLAGAAALCFAVEAPARKK